VLAFIVINLSWDFQKSPVFERPIETTVVFLFCSACGLLLLRAATGARFFSPPRHVDDDRASHFPEDVPSVKVASKSTASVSSRPWLFVLLVSALCCRVQIVRVLLNGHQCIATGVEGFLPLLLAVHDYWWKQRRRSADDNTSHDQKSGSFVQRLFLGQHRYVLPTTVLGITYVFIVSCTSSPQSTYVCPLSNLNRLGIPLMQALGVSLDFLVLISLPAALEPQVSTAGATKAGTPVFVGIVLLASAILVALGGLIAFYTHPREWIWVLSPGSVYWGSLAFWTLLLTIALPCALKLILSYGPLHLAMCLYISMSYASLFSLAQWNADPPTFLPPASSSVKLLVTLTICFILYLQALSSDRNVNGPTPRIRFHGRVPLTAIGIVVLVFWSWSFLRLPHYSGSSAHPIDSLLTAASAQHDAWLQQASTSNGLGECVNEYKRRYKRNPPPGFDAWHRYAIERFSAVIDDFDNLMDDLQLFWALKPSEIRRRTREAISDPWNEVAEIRIRSGKAEIGPDVKPTHRWMLDGVIAMMKNYIEKIPDMDLGFNINDEPRIAIPYNDLQGLHTDSVPTEPPKSNPFNETSKDRAAGWNFSDSSFPNKPFIDYSFQPTFHSHGSISCHPSSFARRSHLWDTLPLCTSCLAPHSTGLFLSNWTLSASPCHQPDLAHLHGFYLSPAAFKPSKVLYPVFSQSKAAGYADIRYPSPWNYIDKAVYRPTDEFPDLPFAEKESTLFWRGATSEGLSRYGEWKGMARQRLVHLANNASTKFPILLPSFPHISSNARYQPTYTTHHVPSTMLPELGLNISSIALVNKIDRCWDDDCPAQLREFGVVGPSDFQSHWHYKYLIDLDGAGFSGRFIPFLQSRSLPFKVAGVFREWWDGRVTAWKHFVPIDIRLHGLWSTLAYFHGVKPTEGKGGRKAVTEMKARTEEGERITEEGRDWVGKVMRKEDMEIYFYRLLLEWGRLTDDARDDIGFSMW
ncbi:MAG: hypothetical protein L6R42_005944, partial [Xanthoria sp. 1 TBL-2021]